MSNISVQLIDHMGNDTRVAEVARVSFSKGQFDISEDLLPKDQNLINFLARGCRADEYDELLGRIQTGVLDRKEAVKLYENIRHQATHWTPFAHTAFTLQIKAPIPVRTQAFKHTIGLVANEESRRYVFDTPELFLPDYLRSKPVGSIKQGSGDIHPESTEWMVEYEKYCNAAIKLYEDMIDSGICPEQARFVLPQGVMVNWVWTGNIVAFANFYNKRIDPHAQKEIQELARLMKQQIEPTMPASWAALTRSIVE